MAGAGYLLNWDIVQFIRFTGHTLAETIRLCTLNPAALLNLSPDVGTLAVGASANITLFTKPPDAQALRIIKTIRNGVEVYSAAS